LGRAAVDEKNVLGTGHLVQSAKPLEERFEGRVQRVQPPIEAAPAKPTPEVGRALKQVQGSFKIATEKAGRDNSGGHHLRVGDLPLGTFLVAAGSEPIVGKAVNGYDSGVHGTGNLRERN
jgi:hypothetical protein